MLISKQNITISGQFTAFAIDITAIGTRLLGVQTRQDRAGTGIHVCLILVVDKVCTTTGLQAKEFVKLILYTQIKHGTITGILVRSFVNQPIGILLKVACTYTGVLIPSLIHHITRRIKYLIVLFIVVEVFAPFYSTTWEVIKTYQRIHIVTAGSYTVVTTLVHTINISINSQLVIQEIGSFAEVEVMLHQTIVFYHTLSYGIGIREISLHSLRTHAQRKGVDGSYTGSEELVGIIGTTVDFTTPTLAGTCIMVLKLGNAISRIINRRT